MKKTIITSEKNDFAIKDNLIKFNQFKKDWSKENNIFLVKLMDFNFFVNKSKDTSLALDFRNINNFEIPVLEDIKDLKYIFINSNCIDKFKYINKNKKLIFSFDDFDLSFPRNIKNSLKDLFKKTDDVSENSFNKMLKNILIEIPIKSQREDEIFKSVIFVKKVLTDILGSNNIKDIKIILKNNFSNEENQLILKNKILSGLVAGVFIEN